tara:strand:+ start:604 stop:2025 length:1422 start_codon:yes stop_codon:yes gene_type:complete
MRNKKTYPYPQIVTGENWTVHETHDQPRTDNQNRQMYVPLDKECTECGANHSKMIRRHELAHVKWSPKTIGKLKPDVRKEAIEVLEEIRINYLLSKSKLPLEEPTVCIEKIKITSTKMAYESSLAELILFGLAGAWYKDIYKDIFKYEKGDEFEAFTDALSLVKNDVTVSDLRKIEIDFVIQTVNKYVGLIIEHRYGQKPSYRKVQRHAVTLSTILNMFMDKPIPEEVYKPVSIDKDKVNEDEDKEMADEIESNKLDGSTLESRMRRGLMEEMQYQSSNGIGQWGDMKTLNPALTVNLQGRLKHGRNYRPMEYGYNPKYIHRWCTDKKIFKQKRNVLGGTILIDASGSMDFTGEDILEIMSLLPAVTIAMYNGMGTSGTLRVIAKKGMRVTENELEDWSGYGNVVDGPALEWLTSMPERRIWVSDMKVFGGYGDISGFNLITDIYRLCTSNRIINLKDIDEVKEHAIKLNVVE